MILGRSLRKPTKISQHFLRISTISPTPGRVHILPSIYSSVVFTNFSNASQQCLSVISLTRLHTFGEFCWYLLTSCVHSETCLLTNSVVNYVWFRSFLSNIYPKKPRFFLEFHHQHMLLEKYMFALLT